MALILSGSVGRDGDNRADDVRAVQRRLNAFAAQMRLEPLSVSGDADAATLAAILVFQRKVVKLPKPDGTIDAQGRTVRALGRPAEGEAPVTAPVAVHYHETVPEAVRLASDYALRVVERALATAGLTGAAITSTLRLPAEQASIMYRMAMQDLGKQRALYGPAGNKVLDVFAAHRAEPRQQVIDRMRRRIEELHARGERVSRHVATPEGYRALNVIDLGVNSTRAVAGASFTPRSKARLTQAFAALEDQGFIAKFIDETGKSNNCWHIEVKPNAKALD